MAIPNRAETNRFVQVRGSAFVIQVIQVVCSGNVKF